MLTSARAVLCGMFLALAAFASCCRAEADDKRLPVPSVTIHPGDTIKDEMLAERSFANSLQTMSMFIDVRSNLVGRMARRTLLPGQPIPTNAVDDPWAVTRGAVVKVVVEDDGMSIVTYGSALQSGAAGTVIPVRNVDTGVVIKGVVQPDGSVRISAG